MRKTHQISQMLTNGMISLKIRATTYGKSLVKNSTKYKSCLMEWFYDWVVYIPKIILNKNRNRT